MKIPFFDLTRQYEQIRDRVEPVVHEVLNSQKCIGGVHVEQLERRLSQRVGVDHAIGVSSGTDALLVSLMALDIGEGDEVITTPFTFFSPVEAVLRRGADPVFVDIDPETFNLDVGQLEDAITDRTRAIIPVHLFGQTCEMTEVCRMAEEYDLEIVEDMAQSIDAVHDGEPAGGFGTTGCLSFYPTKNLGGVGDGGMVFCDDDELADRIRRLCRHGAAPKYHHVEVGGNFRLDAIQAAVLKVKLDELDWWSEARRRHAAYYTEVLSELTEVKTPAVSERNRSVFNQYVIRVEERDALRDFLADRGVGTNIYYPQPLHTQPALERTRYSKGDFPKAERVCQQVLALPVFPELRDQEREYVGQLIEEFYR